MSKDDVIASLPDILKSVLTEVILHIPRISPDKVSQLFGRLSNPSSLKKVVCYQFMVKKLFISDLWAV